ncbi:arginyl-tRNA--protein transferase 1 [Neocloeon triangulifer]|uniref:arginyl-tRNA--protein transferase 1 n=1 Tax=Neocloeon triangulifer TaxID=2078957 RepID=UPI00286EFB19|nr:arginyl-tRNA--protein transferase 1 [Neocloeon triangulifer]
MPSRNFSIVEFFGGDEDDSEGSSCGYCKNHGSISTGMWAHNLSVQDYQDLIDRGWRRSGCYCYKPTMSQTCCPAYTIKCDTSKFQLSKSQKKVLKKFNKYLLEGQTVKEENSDDKSSPANHSTALTDETCTDLPDLSLKAESKLQSSGSVNPINITFVEAAVPENDAQEKSAETVKSNSFKSTEDKKDSGSLRPCKKAKLLRKERRVERLKSKGLNPEEVKSKHNQEVKTLEQYIASAPHFKHKLELRLVQSNPPSPEYEATEKDSHEIYCKYQISVHDDPPEKVTLKQFRRFLVDSPLEAEENEDGIKYGSFHQQYWLDGKLIAVAVIDILPSCVSSVYFYYDPDFRFLTLGTYAALREISLTRELNIKNKNLVNYYMGFYIHSCPKMRYKGQYSPSYLLCPVSYTWHPIARCHALLDKSKYVEFDVDNTERIVDYSDLMKMLVLHGRKAMPFGVYAAKKGGLSNDEISTLKFYIQLVGTICASRMLLFRA